MRFLIDAYDPNLTKKLEKFGHTVKTIQYHPSFLSIREMLQHVDPFTPDVLLHYKPELLGIPFDYFESPIPIIHLITDYHVGIQSLTLGAPILQNAIINTSEAIDFLKKAGLKNCNYGLLTAELSAKVIDFQGERPIDVIFIGTIEENGYPRRVTLIQKLLELIPEYKITIIGGTHKESCLELYAKSKIVLNHSTLDGVLLQRTIDTLAAGSLVLINQENYGALDWLKDGHEAVSYNENNLIDRIKYYLSHEKERMEIAKRGQQKLANSQKNYKQEEEKFVALLTQAHLRPLNTLEQKVNGFGAGLFPIPPDELTNLDGNEIVLNNIGASYWNCYSSNRTIEASLRQQYVQNALLHLKRAVQKNQAFLPSLWNLGAILHQLKESKEAYLHLNQALKLVLDGAQWPFEARCVKPYGLFDPYAKNFSQAFLGEKLGNKDASKEIQKVVLRGIFSWLIEMLPETDKAIHGLRLLHQWESLEPTDELVIEVTRAKILQNFSEKAFLEVLERLIDTHPLSYQTQFLRQVVPYFSKYRMERGIMLIIHSLIRRHLAASMNETNEKEITALLKEKPESFSFEKGLALLNSFSTLNDVLSYDIS